MSDDVDETPESEQEPDAKATEQGPGPAAEQWPAAAATAPEGAAAQEDADEETAQEGPGLGKSLLVEGHDLPGALEALILVSDKPVSAVRLARLSRSDLDDVKAALGDLREVYQDRGIVLDEVAGGYQFRTHRRYSPVVRSLIQQKPVRLTKAQLEVLSIIAYRQPVTRPEVEDVRGVDSGSALRVLLERGVIRIIGKKDEAGRPMLYATTPDFLSLFGLRSLRDLPTLKEFSDLSDESRDMFERRIGERPPLEGFTDDARDARSAAEQEQALRDSAEGADDEVPSQGESPVEAELVEEALAEPAATDDEADVPDAEFEPTDEPEDPPDAEIEGDSAEPTSRA